jgi:YaiO family outer membrane protein
VSRGLLPGGIQLAVAAALLLGSAGIGATGADASGAQPAEARGPGEEIEQLAGRLVQAPEDHDTRFAYARQLSWHGRWEEALAEYDRLLMVDPDNADYLLGKAQVLSWSGRPDQAVPLLEKAAALAPEYAAVRELQASLLRQADDRPVREIEAGLGWQDLDSGLPAWSEQYLEFSRRSAARQVLYGGLRRTERFDLADLEGSLGFSRPLTGAWLAAVEGRIAPGAEVLPRWSGQLRVRRDFGGGWGAELGARRAAYARDELDIWTLAVDRYFSHWYVGWAVLAGKLEGANLTWSNQLRLDRHYGDGSRLGAIASTGRETDSLGDGRFTTNSTLGLSLQGLHRFSTRYGISWELLVHEQGDAYLRRGFRVGLVCRY